MKEKSYRAIRHDVVRKKQKENSDEVHHPTEKIAQIEKILEGQENLKILELFAGQGNLTKVYDKFVGKKGFIECYDIKTLKTGDSYLVFHKLISEKKKYQVIDIDPYGFPLKMLSDIWMLVEDGYIFMTMPKPWVNIRNGITRQTLTNYFGNDNPTLEEIQERLKTYALCHWRTIDFLDVTDLGRLWRFGMKVKRVKATEYCGVRNR